MAGGMNNWRAACAAVRDQITLVVSKTAFDVERGTVDRAPVDTGNLKGSYGVTVEGMEAAVSTAVEYAPDQEYGTIHQDGTPHLIPAVEQARPGWESGLRQVGDNARRGFP